MAKRSRRDRKTQSPTTQAAPSTPTTPDAPAPVRSGATGNHIDLSVEYSYVYTDLRAILLTVIAMIMVIIGMAYIVV